MSARKLFGTGILAASVLILIYGLVVASPFRPGVYTAQAPRAMAQYFLFAFALLFAAYRLSRRFRLSFPALCGAALALISVGLYGPGPVAAVGVFCLASFALGSITLRGPAPRPEPLLTFIAGLAAFALLFTWISAWPVNTTALHFGLEGAPLLAAALLFRNKLGPRLVLGCFSAPPASATTDFLWATLAMIGAFGLLAGAGPEIGYDGLVWHLYIPSYVKGHRQWAYDPVLYSFSHMPLAVDFLYTHLFLTGGEGAARLWNAAAGLLAGIGAIHLATRAGFRKAGLAATILWISTPLAFVESSSLWIENTLAVWILGAAIAGLPAPEEKASSRWFALCLCAAATVAGKLHGAVAVPLLLGVGVYHFRTLRRAPLLLAAGAFIIFLGAFPYIYAWKKMGNPVYPYFNDIFQAPFFPMFRFVDQRWAKPESWTILYDLTISSSRYFEGGDGLFGFVWLAFLPYALWAALTQRNRTALVSAAIGLFGAIFPALTLRYLRYFFPFLPLLTPALACGLRELCFTRGLRAVGVSVLALMVGAQLLLLPLAYDFDLRTWQKLLKPAEATATELQLAPARLANRFLNERAPGEKRVLYSEQPTGALLEGTAVYVQWYSTYFHWLAGRVADSESAEIFLKENDIRFVVQPRNPVETFAKVMGNHLAGTRRPIAEFGEVLVYEIQ